MNHLPFYIVNLEKSLDRREAITARFENLTEKVPYQFFKAVNGKENPDHPLFKKHNHKKRLLRKGYPASLGQLGCFASHYLLWQECVKSNEPMVIIEDDAELNKNFLNTYHFLQSDKNQYEFLWLCPANKKLRPLKIFNYPEYQLEVGRFHNSWSSTVCYYLTPQAAEKLLRQTTQEWVYEVDITIDRYYENGLSWYAVVPPMASQAPDVETNITLLREKQSLPRKLLREYFNFIDRVHRRIYNYTHP